MRASNIVRASVVAVAIAASHASLTLAQTGPAGEDAKTSFMKGVELYNADDYKGALAEFLAAYEAKPHHSVLFNIAQCYQMIDATAMALHYYRQYLEMGGDLISQSRKEMVQEEIEKLLDQLTPITLTVKPDGADVTIDGKSVGISPVTEVQYVDPGEHMLLVQLLDHDICKKTFVAKRGVPLAIEVTLVPEKEPVEPEVVEPPPHETPSATEPPIEEPKPASAHGGPRTSDGGIGIVLGTEATAIFNEDQAYKSGIKVDSGTKMDAGVYLALFGEKLVAPCFAIGAEASLVITDVDSIRTRTWDPSTATWSYPNPWNPCGNCERPIAFTFALRLKWPIPVTGVLGVYPIATVGMGTATLRFSENVYANHDTLTFFGMSYSGGLGIEFYTPAPVTPFLEIRYLGGFGTITDRDGIEQYWIHLGDDLEKYLLVHHSLTIGIGTRFL